MATQIPGGLAVKRYGPHRVISANGVVMAAVLMTLPAAGRAGAWAVCAAFLALGLVQGPYIAAMAVLQNSIMPAASSPAASERPLAQMIIRLGQQAAKLTAAVVPWVAGRWGWAVFPRALGVGALLSTCGFLALAPRAPQPAPGEGSEGRRQGRPVSALRLVCSAPAQAALLNHLGHDTMEQHILGACE